MNSLQPVLLSRPVGRLALTSAFDPVVHFNHSRFKSTAEAQEQALKVDSGLVQAIATSQDRDMKWNAMFGQERAASTVDEPLARFKAMRFRAAQIALLLVAASPWMAPAALADDPATAVARISLMQGAVSTQRGDSGDWNAATVNTPVVPGDCVSTGERSRAEIQLDFPNLLRLDERSVVRVADLTPQRLQIEVSQGQVSFTAFRNSDADVEIDTPNLAIHPRHDGVYRIQVNSDGETMVTVRRGEAEVGTAEGSTTLEPGQMITVRGDSTSAQYKLEPAPARDGFDNWNEERDRLLATAQNSPNLNPYYTGSADLNKNGTWQNAPDYGPVWTPSDVPPDWAPYRDGAWVWEPAWGWTWVSYEPWGWAPYHYGRWFLYGGRWAWWPGPITPYYRPIWAPAYVSFFGFGRHFGVGIGFGSYGWLPIGPGDLFYPWWGFGVSFGFADFHHFYGGRGFVAPLAGPFRGRAAISNLNGLETNARLRAGITSVSAQRFGNGRVVPEGRRIGAEEIRGAQFAQGRLPVTPGRASLSASGRPASRGTVPSRNLESQHFYSRTQPRAAQNSFARESAQVRQQIEQQRSPAANSPGNLTGRESGFGSGRAGETARQPAARQDEAPLGRSAGQTAGATEPRANSNAPGDGWHRFNSPQGQSGSQSSRGSAWNPQSYRDSQRSASRPQLDLHKSIVQQRAPSYGYGRSSSPVARPSYSAPPSQPSYRAPQAPRGYSSAPRSSAPSVPRGSSGGGSRGGGASRPSGSSRHPGHR